MLIEKKEKIKLTWSSGLAYAIGVIASDGNLSKDGRHIRLKSVDLELVENFKGALKLKNAIKEGRDTRGKRKTPYRIEFSDIKFYTFLNKIGITSTKSKTIKSIKVPNKYFRNFIRGVFDGDGTFYTTWDKRWRKSFVFQTSFASASREFLEWLKQTIKTLYKTKGFIQKGKGVYNLRYVKGDSRILYQIMYGHNPEYFLPRKRKKIETALQEDIYLGRLSLQKQNTPR